MSLVEDARRVMDRAVKVNEFRGKRGTACHLCSWARVYWGDEPIEHSPDCPVPALPKIVAALEAAERLADVVAVAEDSLCPVCSSFMHREDCEQQALIVALRGDEVTV